MTNNSIRTGSMPFPALLDRRRALSLGGAGFLGFSMPKLLAAADRAAESKPKGSSRPAGPAKSVIFLYQFGGPSHVDTFDMKPDAPEGIRSLFGTIATRVPGLRICEHLPRMAEVMDKVCLVRSVSHTMKNHNSASYYALTGHEPPTDDIRLRDTIDLYPAYGSVADRFVPSSGGLPSFVSFPHVIRDGSVTPGQRASFLGAGHDPLVVASDPNEPEFHLPELTLPESITPDRMADRRAMQSLIDQQLRMQEFSSQARGLNAYYDKAIGLMQSSEIRRAFDLTGEPAALRERYGRTTYGQSCLLARRLVESGVRFVNVYFSPTIGGQSFTSGGWDTHGFNNTRQYPILQSWQLPLTDHTLPVLLDDLESRGLLDSTLVVWMGEFGRTPKINDNISRDHWPHCYTVLFAGGGTKRGYQFGASDESGAYPEVDKVRPDDVAATMFALLGIDPHAQIPDRLNRPHAISSGQAIEAVIA